MNTAAKTNNCPLVPVKFELTERRLKNFWKKVDRSDHPKGCWVWTGTRCRKGYGYFGVGLPTLKRAHRVSYCIKHGEIPAALCILHHCDNPSCVNPDHLFTGTDLDNSNDKISKGRFRSNPGEKNGGGQKLKWEQVQEIRRLRESGLSQQAIADIFGVSQPMIGIIVRGEQWKVSGRTHG